MAKRHFSRRAEILKRILDWFNRGRFTDFGRFMVFGNVRVCWTGDDEDPEDVQLYLEDDVPTTEESKAWDEINEILSQLNADVDRTDARQYVDDRTSLVNPHGRTIGSTIDQFQAAFEKLSPEAKAVLRMERIKEKLQENSKVLADQKEASSSDDSTYLPDLYYSQEVLAKLEKLRAARIASPPRDNCRHSQRKCQKVF